MLWELTTLRPLNGLAETSIVVGVLSGLPLIASGQSSIGLIRTRSSRFAAATMKFRVTSVLMRPVTRMRTPGTAARDRLPLIGSETAHTPVGCAGKPLLAQQSVGCRDDSAQCRPAQGGPWFAVRYPEGSIEQQRLVAMLRSVDPEPDPACLRVSHQAPRVGLRRTTVVLVEICRETGCPEELGKLTYFRVQR
jgi:hypothetical protein